jgi:hypothetical protein
MTDRQNRLLALIERALGKAVPTLPDLMGLLFGLFPRAGLGGDSLVLPVSEQIKILRTLTSSPLRLALL